MQTNAPPHGVQRDGWNCSRQTGHEEIEIKSPHHGTKLAVATLVTLALLWTSSALFRHERFHANTVVLVSIIFFPTIPRPHEELACAVQPYQ